MKNKLFGYLNTNRRGLALITVLGVVTLATILILALFSVSDTEYKASQSYLDGAKCRTLADSAVNLMISQIQMGATGANVQNKPTIWASQPGAIRVYSSAGQFAMGRRLYSASQMVTAGVGPGAESTFSNPVIPAAWDTMSTSWVDINEPVTVLTPGSTGGLQTYFPILDPRAAVKVIDPKGGGALEPIEGFSFAVNGLSKVPTVSSVEGMTEGNPALRLPMPVEWLYMLQDGSMGTVSAGGGGSAGTWTTVAGGGTPTVENPIIGRMAIWTDDESCKVNVNTAGEPGVYRVPHTFHDRDKNWADSPPVIYEYQRWPGHPATVALSSILAPNAKQSTSNYDGDSYPNFPKSYLDLKSAIYDLAPRIGPGGSGDGRFTFALDDFGQTGKTAEADDLFNQMKVPFTEPLYNSVDEMIFKEHMAGGERKAKDLQGLGHLLITPSVLDRARFFLTANSRSPETNMFGMPRVAIWPVPDKPMGEKFRTPWDWAIELSSTLGQPNSPNTYFFSRRDYASAITDMGGDILLPGTGLKRNSELMSYLDKLTHHTMPGVGGASFFTKYQKDQRQILVEIFDYIRCTNLYDSILDANYVKDRGNKRDRWDDNNPPAAGFTRIASEPVLWTSRPAQLSYYTYTPPRFETVRRVGDLAIVVPDKFKRDFQDETVVTGAYPGHGQVKPIEWTIEGQTFKGFGRLPTISEIALHFICTGDGEVDTGSWAIPKRQGVPDHPPPSRGPVRPVAKDPDYIWSGGKTAQKIDTKKADARLPLVIDVRDPRAMWFSNIPPFPGKKFFEDAGCNFGFLSTGRPQDPLNHPAVDSSTWNCTLDWNAVNGGIALKDDEKRIQIAMELELFVPAAGYTKYTPDFTIVLNGRQLGNLQVRDGEGRWQSMFNTTADAVVQSTAAYMGSLLGEHPGNNAVNAMGGSYGARPLVAGRQVKTFGKMPKDNNYQDSATSNVHGAMLNFPLVSNYFTVKRKQNGGLKFRANGGTGIQADIYASHDWQGKEDKKNSTPSQSVMIKFPDGEQHTPEPWLVVYSTERIDHLDSNGNRYLREAINACRWWAFNFGGAVGRYRGQGQPGGLVGLNWGNVTEQTKIGNPDGVGSGTWGRFHGERSASVSTVDPYNNINPRGANVAMGTIIYGYSNLSDYSGTMSKGSDLVNSDKFEPKGKVMGQYYFYGTDALRSLVPRHGDYRIVAGQRQVQGSMWVPHRLWNTDSLFAHSLSGSTSDSETGFDNGHEINSLNPAEPVADNRLVEGAWYRASQVPDAPLTPQSMALSRATRDFDQGPADMRDGAYINKPDDGNLSVAKFWWGSGSQTEGDDQFHLTRNAYFMSSFLQTPASNAYFTPNRMISSPGVFGSLPTGVYGSPRNDVNGVPWRTLLLRPDVNGHYGAPAWSGGSDPADHYFLDLFWMPVIQPYAISDSYSTAGKINLNFQILPFNHITRSTGLHAALKGELITAMSKYDVNPKIMNGAASNKNPLVYKMFKDDNTFFADKVKNKTKLPRQFWQDSDGMGWHHAINREATIQQLMDRFRFQNGAVAAAGGLMRTPSQVCEMHMVPQPKLVSVGAIPEPRVLAGGSLSALKASMAAFWEYNSITGDNTRETPYANLYQKVTTRSNTYRVYFRVQTIKKARSSDPAQMNETTDSVTGEYRGSALIDRYLDLKGTATFPDYAGSTDPFSLPSLETMYHYRVLEMKQFAP